MRRGNVYIVLCGTTRNYSGAFLLSVIKFKLELNNYLVVRRTRTINYTPKISSARSTSTLPEEEECI